MTQVDNSSPLFASQRETSGAETFNRYRYQYHFALFKALTAHTKAGEYAVLIEYHEDVVFSNSLDRTKAKFEFSQVKTNDEPINVSTIIKLKSGKSIIGKMIVGAKQFETDLNALHLVSANGFDLEMQNPDLHLKQVYLSDLNEDASKKILSALKKEFNDDKFELPAHFSFLKPDLLIGNYRDTILALIVHVIGEAFPDSRSSPEDIYRSLIDELYSKGTVTYDLRKWDELLHAKALTSVTVAKVLSQFTNLRDDGVVQAKFEGIVSELGLNSITKRNLSKAFSRYRLNKTGNRSKSQIDISKDINETITEILGGGLESMEQLLAMTKPRLTAMTIQTFPLAEDLDAAIILEYIDNHL